MPEQYYQVCRQGGFIRLSELVDAKTCSFPAAEPENPNVPEGEWYCRNPCCVVRECRIRSKLYGEALPRLRCPACRSPLAFHHWLAHETLVPVSPPTNGRNANGKA
jgi:hypothetical protein